MNTLEKIGQVIKHSRQKRGLSQEQFCTQCRIDQHYISNIENGQRNLSIAFIEKIACFFGMPLSQFFVEVEKIDGSHSRVPGLMKGSLRDRFISFMQSQHLAKRTIEKYSDGTANCQGVKQIILAVTRTTDDMFHVHDVKMLDMIIKRVIASEFDKVGHTMYSSGLKKYKVFLQSI